MTNRQLTILSWACWVQAPLWVFHGIESRGDAIPILIVPAWNICLGLWFRAGRTPTYKLRPEFPSQEDNPNDS